MGVLFLVGRRIGGACLVGDGEVFREGFEGSGGKVELGEGLEMGDASWWAFH